MVESKNHRHRDPNLRRTLRPSDIQRSSSRSHHAPRPSHLRKVQPKKSSNKTKFLAFGAGAIIIGGLFFGIFTLTQPSHVDVVIHGAAHKLPSETTYSDLQKQGYLNANHGDLLAIDGSVFEAGGGRGPVIASHGEPVENLGAKIKSGDSILDIPGENVTEPIKSEERILPVEATLAAGENFQFYGKTLHMALEKGSEGTEAVETGTLSKISVHGQVTKKMSPTVYGDYLPYFDHDKKVVAFTYDDGPDPTYTQKVLDVLDKHGVKATFFMLGTSVESYPTIARKVADEGHQVASHSYSHASHNYLNVLDTNGTAHQISTAQKVIKEATGVETKTLRPPGGNLSAHGALAGAPWVDVYVGWDIGTGDFNKPGVDHILAAVRDKVHPGGIVLMHDGGGDRTQTVEASDILIGELLGQGYRFVTIDELTEMTREEFSS